MIAERSLLSIAVAVALFSTSNAQTAKPESLMMTKQQTSPMQMPPEIARFLKEVTAQSKQFDFLLGEWEVDAVRLKEDGSPLLQYKAVWSAKALNGGRMIMDDFRALGPSGQAVSSFVTLRTFSEVTNRWELTGLQALQPAMPSEWHGVQSGTEMLLDATGKTPSGDTVKTRIRFFNIVANSFSWESSVSIDGGATWRRTAQLRASRAAQ